ncbi:MAG TPA: hypothetical protein VLK23_03795 [Thermodesulfobacteriota bacterium]|nr:hypothetical protein [Thermodesulfobacteriota bacterium]
MKSEETILQLQSLKKKVRQLSREIASLKVVSLKNHPYAVEDLLKMRGLKVFRRDPIDRLFFPPGLSLPYKTRFYKMMKKYSFRLVLRDMIKHQDRFHEEDLTHYCSPEVAEEYCDFLQEIGVIKTVRSGGYQPRVSPLYSFGPTLEWFTAEMFKREFASSALYGVSIRETASGGDYDVIVSWNRRLVYVEVKSSPPKGIEQNEIDAFFSRIDELLPDVAILFNDTQLRMKDKLVVMFEEALKRRYGGKSKKLFRVSRLVEELFHVRNRIFIINSKRDIFENFSICLKQYLRHSDNLGRK